MAVSGNREEAEGRDLELYSKHRAQREYFSSLENASIAGFPTRYAEEAAIRSGQDYSTWILSAADCDLFMHSLLRTPRSDSRSRVAAHRHKRRHG